ncbi:beta-ketoacyl-[acyl-carrier-protein] synthase I [Bermanella marisrubri]|uniref:3-oxoacyl-[acyl-carrier-protein] synthase 1 n=1 Tax=Bermanella marisrubri TaxID=207949 RepID=Q1N690_9GAMM|nr:beta-ketoacyl synthase N-terminal-like domain-containing protein [Bermanella marisrubri]EAT13702.1 3-oxoacyl-(acyl carrier protein) synthase [Oceanobacter sp. RED65] [Bermanella marisrubri]QIZ84480.1 beta-ketoacyl-[acyl-carrier-protein] synthase I [Bermanella marisrubri]
MNRVAVVGVGLVSSLGNDWKTVAQSLHLSKSGIRINESFIEKGLRSHVSGFIDCPEVENIDRKLRRFMGTNGEWCYVAMKNAVEQAGLTQTELSDESTALIVGAGGVASDDLVDAINVLEKSGIKKVGPYRVTREMGSAPSANLATAFKIRGPSYSVSSACATSAHCIGQGYQLIKTGLQKRVVAGGVDQAHWSHAMQFDAMGALTTKRNDEPSKASRPYDLDRDGFAISGGAGIVVLEDWGTAQERGANIIGEVIGFGQSSDGDNMVAPSGEGAERAMKHALNDAGLETVDYINTHGTSTPRGDLTELQAIKNVFENNIPYISSTKSLSGHGLGAAGVHEFIFSLIMMREGFLAASANLENPEDIAQDMPLLRQRLDQSFSTALSNSFGFGGTNACLIMKQA